MPFVHFTDGVDHRSHSSSRNLIFFHEDANAALCVSVGAICTHFGAELHDTVFKPCGETDECDVRNAREIYFPHLGDEDAYYIVSGDLDNFGEKKCLTEFEYKFENPPHQEAYDFLLNRTYPGRYKTGKQRKNWSKNILRAYKLDNNGLLHYKRRVKKEGDRKKPTSFPRGLRISRSMWRRVLTGKEATDFIHRLHLQAHDGSRRMIKAAGDLYVVHGLCTKVHGASSENCRTCSKFAPAPKPGPQAIITSEALELVMFDLSTFPYYSPEGYKLFMLVVDHFTKFTWFFPLKTKDANEVADDLYWLFTQGNVPPPLRWHSDNGGEFINEIMRDVMTRLGVSKHTTSRPRNPQTQGLVEVRNGTIKKKILELALDQGFVQTKARKHRKKGVQTDENQVMDWVPLARKVVANENDQVCSTYDCSPYLCYHHRERSTQFAPLSTEAIAGLHK